MHPGRLGALPDASEVARTTWRRFQIDFKSSAMVGGKGDEVMQFFQIPYGETRQIRRKGDGSGGSSKKRKRGAAVSQGDEGLPPDDGEAEGGGKSAGDGEEIAASFAV